jgi:flagellin-specific chaperone FliS
MIFDRILKICHSAEKIMDETKMLEKGNNLTLQRLKVF